METRISDKQLLRFGEFVAQTLGLDFPPARWPDSAGIVAIARELGLDDAEACARRLISTPLTAGQLETLASNLTVGETYFFREKGSFEILANRILPTILRARRLGERRLRIWSAACCTGEEPYSIAILLRETIPDWKDWKITLLATDINPRFLRKAEAGIYAQWSFRDAPPGFKQRYFMAAANGQFELLPEIKRMVRFAHLNLVEDVYPSLATDTNAMDVIFCRNVLMYFTAAQAQKVIANLHRAQGDGGYLVVSATELSQVGSHLYSAINLCGATVHQKQSAIAAPAQPIPQTAEDTISPDRSFPPQPENDAYAQAAALYDRGLFAQAAGVLESPPDDGPRDAKEFALLARALANEGKLPQALDCCDRWIAADKCNAAGHYLRAMILQEQGALEAAVRSLHDVLYLDSGFVLAHFALGNIARDRGDARRACKHLKTAQRLLRQRRPEEIVPESDGVTVQRFTQFISSLTQMEPAA